MLWERACVHYAHTRTHTQAYTSKNVTQMQEKQKVTKMAKRMEQPWTCPFLDVSMRELHLIRRMFREPLSHSGCNQEKR
jgi:hypothetical protein